MATKEELATAIKVVKEITGDPSTGPFKELLELLNTPDKEVKNFTQVTETRVMDVKETR